MSRDDDLVWTLACKAGERHYFTGKPCRNGHVSTRYTTGRACTQCVADNARNRKEGKTRQRALAVTVVVYSSEDQLAVMNFAKSLNSTRVGHE